MIVMVNNIITIILGKYFGTRFSSSGSLTHLSSLSVEITIDAGTAPT